MESPDLVPIQNVLRSVEEVINGRQHSAPAVPYFAPTDIGGLPAALQESERQNKEEIAYGNRVRASIQLSLAAAAASLRVCAVLMKDSAGASHAQKIDELRRCAIEAEAAREFAKDATDILAGRALPKADPMTDIRKLKASVFRRFGQS